MNKPPSIEDTGSEDETRSFSETSTNFEGDRDKELSIRAAAFDKRRREETWQQALKLYPKSLMWCAYSLFTCIMWGYDGLASSIVLANQNFRQDYGTEFNGQFVIPAIWQLGLGGASLVGLLIGGYGAGIGCKNWGRKWCLAGGYFLSSIGVILQVTSSPSLPLLFLGKLFTGFPLGIFITLTPTYCSEISPFPLRGAVTSAVNWSIVLGQCLAYLVLRQTQDLTGGLGYKILFGVQGLFVLGGAIGVGWMVESPFWFVEKGRMGEARREAGRLLGRNGEAEEWVECIRVELEERREEGKEAGFKRCFDKVNRKRTWISMSCFFVQNVSGVGWIIGYMAYFLELGGLSTARAFDATVGLSFLMLIGNMFGWVFVEKFGRRGTAVWGSITLTLTLTAIGLTSLLKTPSAIWYQVSFMALWSFIYQSTIGSVAWPLSSELPTSSLRSHTQSLCTISSGLTGAIGGILLPFAVNPDQGNMGGKVAFVYAALMGVCCVGVWWWWPETKGLGFGEIERLFEEGGRSRDFGKKVKSVDEKEL